MVLLQHVGDGRQARVEDDVAGLGQRLVFQVDHVFQRLIGPDDRADQFEALRLGKDQQRAPGKRTLEGLLDRNQLGAAVPRSASFAAVSRVTMCTAGTESSTCSPSIWRRLAAARLTPILAISASASCSIASQFDDVDVHCFAFLRRSVAPDRKARKGLVGQGLGDERGLEFPRARDDLVLQVGGDERDRHLRRAFANPRDQLAGRRGPAC